MFSVFSVLLCMLSGNFFGNQNREFLIITEFCIYENLPEFDEGWFGIFETDSGDILRKVSFELRESSYQPEEGERPEPVFIEFLDEPERPKLIIASSVFQFREGYIQRAVIERSELEVDDALKLTAPGLADIGVLSTEIGLSITDGETVQILTETFREDSTGKSISLEWAGDLDRDGSIDLIINDIDDPYNRFCFKLYLSSEAEEGTLVEEVASFYDVFF